MEHLSHATASSVERDGLRAKIENDDNFRLDSDLRYYASVRMDARLDEYIGYAESGARQMRAGLSFEAVVEILLSEVPSHDKEFAPTIKYLNYFLADTGVRFDDYLNVYQGDKLLYDASEYRDEIDAYATNYAARMESMHQQLADAYYERIKNGTPWMYLSQGIVFDIVNNRLDPAIIARQLNDALARDGMPFRFNDYIEQYVIEEID